jgi:hypothetical protein
LPMFVIEQSLGLYSHREEPYQGKRISNPIDS